MPHCFHHSLSSFLSPILRSLHLFIYLIRVRRLRFSPSSVKTFFIIESNPSCNINEWIIRWCWFHRISHRTVNRTYLSKTHRLCHNFFDAVRRRRSLLISDTLHWFYPFAFIRKRKCLTMRVKRITNIEDSTAKNYVNDVKISISPYESKKEKNK